MRPRSPLPLSLPLALLLLALVGCSSGGDEPATDAAADGPAAVDRGAVADPVSATELREGCARATACGVRPYPNLGSCVDAYHGLFVRQGLGPIYDALYRCANEAAGDCSKIAACFGARDTCDQGYEASCEGTVAVSCDLLDKRVYAFDCAAAGLSCAVKSDKRFTAACTRGACDTSYGDRCSGDTHLTCAASVIETRDCALDGFVCVSTKDGAGCAGNDDVPCREGSVTPFCEGSVAVSCEFVRVHRVDCAAEGLACEKGACLEPSRRCDGTEPDRCNGGKLEACVGDDWVTVDCEGLGLGPCALAPPADTARCTPP